MFAFLGRDAERTPLLRPPMSRSASGVGPSKEELLRYDVFGTILKIRGMVIDHVDSPLSWQKLLEPEITFSIVRPLTDKLVALNNLSTLYCLLSNRLQFISESRALPHARLNTSRADLCEILAIRVMTHFAKPTMVDLTFRRTISVEPRNSLTGQGHGQGYRSAAVEGARQRRMSMAEPLPVRMGKKRNDELRLANLLLAPFHPFSGAPGEVLEEEELEGRKGMGKACNALELAIVTEAKNFISCVSCQKVIDSVYSGRIFYTPSSFFDLLPDSGYKQKAITLYDPRRAPMLDHYRLRVPRYRSMLEFSNFAFVFILLMIVMETKDVERINAWEAVFMVYTCGWALDRFATTLEHGWRIFNANLWNGIDAGIIILFLLYLPLRIIGVLQGDAQISDYALSILSCESSLLFPRLAFFFLAGNVLVMSLRAMLAQFSILMFAAIFIFVGFWHALYTLDEGNYGVWEIAKYMVNIWFGLDSTGFEISTDFHPYLGPVLFFLFACLANTLFITVVVAILSTTFAELNADAKAEFMYRSAVGTFEGVKGDALFSFQPPLNIAALFVLAPASWFLSPRAFHKLHVFLTRLANFPILILISLFERARHYARTSNLPERIQRALPKRMQEFSIFMSGAHADIEAVFDYAPDAKLLAAAAAVDEWATMEGDEEGGNSAFTRHSIGGGPTRGSLDLRTAMRENNTARGTDMSQGSAVESSDEEATSPEEYEEDEDSEVLAGESGVSPLNGRGEEHEEDQFGSVPMNLPTPPATAAATEGILSTSPTRTRAMGMVMPTHLTFDSSPRRESYPPLGTATAAAPKAKGRVKRQESKSVLQKLYERDKDKDRDYAFQPTLSRAGGGGDDAMPPSWVLQLNATLRGIENRQKRLEEIISKTEGLSLDSDRDEEGRG